MAGAKRSLGRTFVYEGRSGRGEYFAWFFIGLMFLPLGPLALPAFVPGFAVTVRRLHDLDRTGRWALLPAAPFLFHLAVTVSGLPAKPLWPLTMLAIIFVPIGFVIWMSRPGSPGPNRYGEPDAPTDPTMVAIRSPDGP